MCFLSWKVLKQILVSQSEYWPTLDLLFPTEKPSWSWTQKLWDGPECQLPFITFTLLVFPNSREKPSVHISLAKFGRQKAHKKDYIFKESKMVHISYESTKHMNVWLICKMYMCQQSIGAIMKWWYQGNTNGIQKKKNHNTWK